MNRKRIAAMAIALITASALPLAPAQAHDDRGHKGHGGHGYHYKAHKKHARHHYKHHHKHGHKHWRHKYKHGHHHHGHGHGYYKYRPWRCGSRIGVVYDSWSDSWRLGGSTCFY